ncbi:MAG: hypothetical protein EBS55_06600 [Flavobacteriaceae bacterium]|nr:hypothetical protein [Flavobacteriaceae bacterium]
MANKSILDELKSILNPKSYGDVIQTLDTAASGMLNQFGQAQAMAQTLRQSIADASMGVIALGGTIEDIQKNLVQVSEAIGRNVIVAADASAELYATSMVTGQSVKDLVKGMADVGISSLNTAEEMKKVVDIARNQGVSALAVSEGVMENMEYINKFNFEGGVSGLAKMAAQATMLRVDMSKTLSLAEELFSPDKAIEVAASMQRLGVAQSDLLDPLRLMELAQNDPAELQNQIAQMSKQFVQLGKDGHFEIMPGAKRQLKEISEQLGIPYQQLTNMALAGADLDKKLSQIKFPDTFVNEDQKNLIANMAEMGEGGEYVIKTVQGETKAVSALSEKDIKALEENAKKAPPTMEEYAKQQTNTLDNIYNLIQSLIEAPKIGVAATKTTGKVLSAGRDIAESVTKVVPEKFSPKGIRTGIDTMLDGGKSLQDFVSFMGGELKDSFVKSQVEIDKLNEKYPVLGQVMDFIKDNFSPTQTGRDVLKLPGQNIQLLPEDTFAAFTKGNEVLNGIANGRGNNATTTPTKSSMDLNHNLTININAPSHVNTNQLMEMFKDTGVTQAMSVAVKEAFNNGGLTAPTSNKQQLLNPGIGQYS